METAWKPYDNSHNEVSNKWLIEMNANVLSIYSKCEICEYKSKPRKSLEEHIEFYLQLLRVQNRTLRFKKHVEGLHT